jgi:predicted DNA-binding ribbon-helix-helix protein
VVTATGSTMGLLKKRTVEVDGHKTSVSVENEFWDALREMAGVKQITIKRLVEEIERERTSENLSSAIRLFVVEYYRIVSQV